MKEELSKNYHKIGLQILFNQFMSWCLCKNKATKKN